MTERRPEVFLADILREAEAVEQLVNDIDHERRERDFVVSRALERMLGIIGEAVRGLSGIIDDTEQRIPDAVRIVGMRNHLIHGYRQTDDAIVWDAAVHDVPVLRAQAEAWLRELDPDSPVH